MVWPARGDLGGGGVADGSGIVCYEGGVAEGNEARKEALQKARST